MVRITTPTLQEVESLKKIHTLLRERGYFQPLVADVHYQPRVAEEVAKFIEKVRINPGNFIPGKYRGPREFDSSEQQLQILKIREKLLPLIHICKENNTALRIGVNHGSLSERILNWYGDTPEGMVESALEFLRIFQEEKFHKIVISLKASSSRVMVAANRLLVNRMNEMDLRYPLHLGVTEAGDEEEGRIKSAVGICSLLADGIGDTIRVSLTEDPEEEIPVAKRIADVYNRKKYVSNVIFKAPGYFEPFSFRRRSSRTIRNIGENFPPVVINSAKCESMKDFHLDEYGVRIHPDGTMETETTAPDYFFCREYEDEGPETSGMQIIIDHEKWSALKNKAGKYPVFKPGHIFRQTGTCDLNFLFITPEDTASVISGLTDKQQNLVLILDLGHFRVLNTGREFFKQLWELNSSLPVILYRQYNSPQPEDLMIRASAELGALIQDELGDGIWIEDVNPEISIKTLRSISFNILQACSSRISRTEYISCPSCGRTLFNIQSALKKIKHATADLKGLKIAVMGCIVNGPGEMADADYGYVGAGPGIITLYKGRLAVKKNIPEENAVEELLKLIKEDEK